MLNNYIKGLIVLLLLIIPLTANSQQATSDVEALKTQIEEMRRQNEEMIKKIQEQNAKQIEQLQQQINELEKSRPEQQIIKKEVIVDEETLDKKIEKSVDENIILRTKDWLRLSYNKDLPSYFRTRARFINNGTFLSVTNSEDEVFFVDSRLLLSPAIYISDFVSIRSQFDIAKNIIWGGLGDQVVSDKTFSAPSPGDSFKGAVLRDVVDTFFGSETNATEEVDLVDIRSLYAVTKMDYGEIWIGRQPFDWGLGVFNNAGSMPDQDLGSIVDRFEFDTAPFSLIDKKYEDILVGFIVDRLSEGLSIGNFDEGDGWDVGLALYYDTPDLSIGAYIFGIYQNNFSLGEGITADLDPAINWSVYASYRYNRARFSFEFQNLFGEIKDIGEPANLLLGQDNIDISASNIATVARVEYHPPINEIRSANLEFGWASGDDTTTPNKLEGNAIFFNNAYVIDGLLYKHMIPTIYAFDGSVINSYYVRGWSTLNLTDKLYLTPQAILGFVDEKNALSFNLFEPLPAVDSYLGTELEATLTWKLRDHVWFDLIGSVVFAGQGLKDLLSQRALIQGAVESLDNANPPDTPYAIQGRFIVTLDGIIDRWNGSSTVRRRAWFDQ